MSKTFFLTQENNLSPQEQHPDTSLTSNTEAGNPPANQDTSSSAQAAFHKLKTEKGFTFTDNDSLTSANPFSGGPGPADLFKGHSLQPSRTNPSPLKRSTPDWFTISLFITIGFFTWLKLKNGKIIQQLFSAFFNNSVTNQIVRDENVLVQKTSVMLSLVFYFSSALLLYEVSIHFDWEYKIIGKGLVRFIIFVLFLASAYSFKMVFLKIMSTIFQMEKAVSTYIFNIFLINDIIGILLIPMVMLIKFFPYATDLFIWTAIMMVLIAFLYRLFRGIIIWISLSRFSLYYLILYLCALEIAPLLIIFKLA